MNYGKFSEDSKEFIVNNPATPRPWINYLCTRSGSYVSLLSANAGGYSYIKCPKDGRLTRWRYNSLPDDRPGKYIYLRNSQTGKYWSLSWQPTAKPAEHYKVRHGLGYTVFECDYAGIQAEATYFVPLDDTCEIWQVKLKNTTSEKISLEVYPFAEMCLGHALIDLINKPNDQHFNRLWFDETANAIFSTKTYWVTGSSANIQENKSWDQVAFMSASIPSSAYAGEREEFFGPYRDERNPQAIEDGILRSSQVSSGNLVSSLQLKMDIEPGETKEFHITLGAAEKVLHEVGAETPDDERGGCPLQTPPKMEEACLRLVDKYKSSDVVKNALSDVKQYWMNYCSAVQIDTPCEEMNSYINAWNQYQGKITFINSRNASYYHWGVHRGMGFRDALQDTISVVISEPKLVRERILLLAKYQRSDGVCAHCFHPISGEAEFTGHRDDPLWLVTAVWYYLAETDDASILNESVPFFDGKSANLADHLNASVDFIEKNLGKNGIPTFGRGDWNDTLDFVGGEDGAGESVWAGMFYAFNLRRLKEIIDKYRTAIMFTYEAGDLTAYLNSIQKRYETLCESLNSNAWDGEWYIRAVCSDGSKLGSAECDEGKIYLNPQTWAVLSGVAGDKSDALLEETLEKLDTEYGPKLLAPAYHNIDPNVGLITRCVWGKKENGSIFNHTTTWALMALCELSNNEKVFDLYKRLMPVSFDQNRYQIEPYVYAQYTTSDEHESFGQGSHSWLTGTAAWMFRATLDYILGIRVTLDGILIKPCVSSDWKEFCVIRKYRSSIYNIKFSNSGNDKLEIKVNGKTHPDNTPLPIEKDQEFIVEVTM
jgi:cellobiose phosphorylase